MRSDKGKEKERLTSESNTFDLHLNSAANWTSLLASLNEMKIALNTYKPSSFLGFRDEEKSKKKAQAIKAFIEAVQDVNSENLDIKNINKVLTEFDTLYKTNKSLEKDEFGGNLGKIIQKFKPKMDAAKKEFDDVIASYKTELLQALDKLRIQLSLTDFSDYRHFEYYKFRLAGEAIDEQTNTISSMNFFNLQKQLMKLDWDLNQDEIIKESVARSSAKDKVTPQDILLERYKIRELHHAILILEKEFLKQKSDEASETFEELKQDASSAIDRYNIEQKYLPWLEASRKSTGLSLTGSSDLQAITFTEGVNESNIQNIISESDEIIKRAKETLAQDISKKDPYTGEQRAGSRQVRTEEEWVNDLAAKTIIFLRADKLTPHDIKPMANEFPERERDNKLKELSKLLVHKQGEVNEMQLEADKLVKDKGKEKTLSYSLK